MRRVHNVRAHVLVSREIRSTPDYNRHKVKILRSTFYHAHVCVLPASAQELIFTDKEVCVGVHHLMLRTCKNGPKGLQEGTTSYNKQHFTWVRRICPFVELFVNENDTQEYCILENLRLGKSFICTKCV